MEFLVLSFVSLTLGLPPGNGLGKHRYIDQKWTRIELKVKRSLRPSFRVRRSGLFLFATEVVLQEPHLLNADIEMHNSRDA